MSNAYWSNKFGEAIRVVRFRPYRREERTSFTLCLYETNSVDSAGRNGVAYRLSQHKKGRASAIFAPETSPLAYMHCAIDSDEAVASVMGWLTLKPGDTDADYFAEYTEAQLEFAKAHGETLSCEVMNRFGEF